jgi:hypothetical protein
MPAVLDQLGPEQVLDNLELWAVTAAQVVMHLTLGQEKLDLMEITIM